MLCWSSSSACRCQLCSQDTHWLHLGEAAPARHAPEMQEARQERERAPQPRAPARQHAAALHLALLAHGQARSQRRPRREHRRDLVPPPTRATSRVGPPRRRTGSAAGQQEGGHDVHGRLQHGPGPLDVLVQIVHQGKTDAVLPEQPWPERTHHVTSENGWATTTTILQLAAILDDMLNPIKEGQAWILLWDMASIHARGNPGCHVGRFPSHRARIPPATKHVVLAALRRGRLPQLQELHPDAGERHSCPLRPR